VTEALVSIIIPVYNTKEYLEVCVNSVRNQTYKNIEIILIDDGSENETAQLCDEISKSDSRIKVHHQKNGGLSAARNKGITLSTGKYIMFVDSDDYIHSQMVQKLYEWLVSHNADVAVCDYERVKEFATEVPEKLLSASEEKIYENEEILDRIYSAEYVKYIVCWNKLYKRELITDIQFPINRIHEDEFFTPRVLQKAQKAVWLNEKLYYYVIREGSLSKSGLEKSSRHKLLCMKENALFFKSINACHAYQKESIRYLKAIIYFSGQFYKKLPTSKERLGELHNEFESFYKSYEGPKIKTIYTISFWAFLNMQYVYLFVIGILRTLLRK